jgi:dienelactone hydrolase
VKTNRKRSAKRALLIAFVLVSGAGRAADSGMVSFQSAGSLQRGAAAEPYVLSANSVTLSGELLFPEGDGPFPAVVLAHGCAGNRYVESAWGPFLRRLGYATFNTDSFSGRGISEVCTQAGLLSSLQRVPDAYGALRLLAAHPKIDPKRIALMGFSHGGILTMLSSTSWAKETFAPGGQAAFRAFFPFYPYCNAVFPERDRVSAPVRIHSGEKDDWTPAKPCAELAASLKASGQDVAISIYPGAVHSFDQASKYAFLPNVTSAADCYPQSPSILGPIVPASIGGCIKKGATVGPSASATDQAQKNIRAQLEELMK